MSIDFGWLEPSTSRAGDSETTLSPNPAASLKSGPEFAPPSKALPVATNRERSARLYAIPPQPQIPPPPPFAADTETQVDTSLVATSTPITLPSKGPSSQYDPVGT